ncbi:MAG: hypothetical protein GY750_09460 [Lentisphaerae bacterium]|nr:hypothetical protein [Lentisphaerota bacterium]MCP4101639.1 hypothetical protein [Lentisphaerota bacterium]
MEERILELEKRIEELERTIDIIGEAGNIRERNFWRHAVTRRQFNHLINVVTRQYGELYERFIKCSSHTLKTD